MIRNRVNEIEKFDLIKFIWYVIWWTWFQKNDLIYDLMNMISEKCFDEYDLMKMIWSNLLDKNDTTCNHGAKFLSFLILK